MMGTSQKLILHVADASLNRVHDYQYFHKTGMPEWLEQNPDVKARMDWGYLGANDDYPSADIVLPVKRTKAKKLFRSEKNHGHQKGQGQDLYGVHHCQLKEVRNLRRQVSEFKIEKVKNAVIAFQNAQHYFGFEISTVQTDNGGKFRGDFHDWLTKNHIPTTLFPRDHLAGMPRWREYTEPLMMSSTKTHCESGSPLESGCSTTILTEYI